MANNRAAIRAALKALLLNQTDANENVYTNRETALWQSELPTILIHTPQEEAVPESLRVSRYIRTLQIIVTVKIEATATVDDDLDEMVADVEEIIITNPFIGGTVLSTFLTNTEIRIDSDGEKDVGVAALTFESKYIN